MVGWKTNLNKGNQKRDPTLKACMREIKKTLKKHDVIGSVILSNGYGQNEFRYFLPFTTRSMINNLKGKKKNKMLNAIFGHVDIAKHLVRTLTELTKIVRLHSKFTVEKGEFYFNE